MNHYVIGAGSNINPAEHLQQALDALRQTNTLTVIQSIDPIETTPVGVSNQPNFLNAAHLVATPMSRPELRQTLKSIETAMGRPTPHDPKAPRRIDLDIVVVNNTIVDNDVYSRDYLATMVKELCPGIVFNYE